jgi:uncharacterized protein with HEPN domain
MQNDRLYLIHIREAIKRIQEYAAGTPGEFRASTMKQDAALWNLQFIGESAERLSEPLKGAHPEIDWNNLCAIRHVEVHDKLGIDPDEILDIASRELPPLESKVRQILCTLA